MTQPSPPPGSEYVTREDFELLAQEVRSLRSRVKGVDEALVGHAGEAGAAGMYYPHPYQAVSVLEIGAGFFRGEQGFLQLALDDVAESTRPVIYFVAGEPKPDPSAETKYGTIQGSIGTNAVMEMKALNGTSYGSVLLNSLGRVWITASDGSTFGILKMEAGYAQLQASVGGGIPLYFSGGNTSDPSVIGDSQLWYNSTSDRFKARANSITESVAWLSDLTAFLEAGDQISVLDATAHRMFYSDGSGNVTELAHGTSGQVLTANGTTSAPSWQDAAGGGMSLVVQESDQTINSQTTLQDTELTFAVAANEVFQFEGVIFWNTNAAPDIKFQATGPTGAVGYWGLALANNVNSGTANERYLYGALGTSLAFDVFANGIVRFWGAIHNGANAGSLTIQFAQNTSDANNTIVYAGSYIKYQIEG